MLTIYQATKILELCSISYDIQQKILIFFLSYGTPSSCIIKVDIEEMTNFYKTNLKYIKSFVYPTLWKYTTRGGWPKPFENQSEDYNEKFEYLHELDIAYVKYCIPELYTEIEISQQKIQALTKIRLNKMINENDE